MPAALYFPFSRCLDDVALKQAVLLYDELLFVDPVEPEERAELYRSGPSARYADDSDQNVALKWLVAEQNYKLLSAEGLVRTVNPDRVLDPWRSVDLLAEGLEIDLTHNRGRELFRGQKLWSVLERRLPHGADHPLAQWLKAASSTRTALTGTAAVRRSEFPTRSARR